MGTFSGALMDVKKVQKKINQRQFELYFVLILYSKRGNLFTYESSKCIDGKMNVLINKKVKSQKP